MALPVSDASAPRSAQKMVRLLTLIFVGLIATGCGESEPPVVEKVRVSPKDRFEDVIKESGEIAFFGWDGMEYNGGAHFRLTFQQEGKVNLDTLGYNFVFAYGTFRFEGDSLIAIKFDRIKEAPPDNIRGYKEDWPLLRLSELDGHLRIHREDGETAWHLDWPLYPEITGNLWPISASTQNAEQ